ncbi:MAG: DUF6789 family protein, partial [Acidobacteriota bacterium]
EAGGKCVHYAFGITAGMAYGVGKDLIHARDSRLGVPYGMLIWAGAILVGLPALRLVRAPNRYSLREHGLGILGHLAYGYVLGATYNRIRPA